MWKIQLVFTAAQTDRGPIYKHFTMFTVTPHSLSFVKLKKHECTNLTVTASRCWKLMFLLLSKWVCCSFSCNRESAPVPSLRFLRSMIPCWLHMEISAIHSRAFTFKTSYSAVCGIVDTIEIKACEQSTAPADIPAVIRGEAWTGCNK